MKRVATHHRFVDLLLLGVALAWGSTYLTVKDLTRHSSVLGLLATRFGITTLVLLVLSYRQLRGFTRREVFVGSILGVSQAFILFLEAFGVSKTSATNGGLIISLAIVLTPIIDGAASKKWLPRSFFIACSMAFSGVALLISTNGFHKPNVGDLLFLIAAFARAAHVTALGKMTVGAGFSSMRLTLFQSSICFFIYFLASPQSTVRTVSAYERNDWFGVLYLSIVCTVFAFYVQTWAIRKTSAARASLLVGTEPIWSLIIAVGIGGEKLSGLAGIGAILILAGTFWGAEIEAKVRNRSR